MGIFGESELIMAIYDELTTKVAEAREAGRDVPPVIEELLLFIAGAIDPASVPAPKPAADPAPTAPTA